MIRVGLTELHGIAEEQKKNPPENTVYSLISSTKDFSSFIYRSTAKGVLNYYEGNDVDFIEAPLFPVRTNKNWIYTPADAASAMNFNLLGIPTPRILREIILKNLFTQKNFLGLLFKSQAGLSTLSSYPLLNCDEVQQKTGVLYPAIRSFPEKKFHDRVDKVQILFVGEFFRKGGMHVVDSFLELKVKYPFINLVICANRDIHFEGPEKLKYLSLIDSCESININYMSREKLFDIAYKESDIFILPTYEESFGYSILEAMANSLPIIATDHFAIPEIVENGKSGILISDEEGILGGFSRGYKVQEIPVYLKEMITRKVSSSLDQLISNVDMRRSMGAEGRRIACEKFSFEIRNSKLKEIYKIC